VISTKIRCCVGAIWATQVVFCEAEHPPSRIRLGNRTLERTQARERDGTELPCLTRHPNRFVGAGGGRSEAAGIRTFDQETMQMGAAPLKIGGRVGSLGGAERQANLPWHVREPAEGSVSQAPAFVSERKSGEGGWVCGVSHRSADRRRRVLRLLGRQGLAWWGWRGGRQRFRGVARRASGDRDLGAGNDGAVSALGGERERVAPASQVPGGEQPDLRSGARLAGVAGGVDHTVAW
jgi:hypothetical protein